MNTPWKKLADRCCVWRQYNCEFISSTILKDNTKIFALVKPWSVTPTVLVREKNPGGARKGEQKVLLASFTCTVVVVGNCQFGTIKVSNLRPTNNNVGSHAVKLQAQTTSRSSCHCLKPEVLMCTIGSNDHNSVHGKCRP